MDAAVLEQQQLAPHFSSFEQGAIQALQHDPNGLASQLNPQLAPIHPTPQAPLPRYSPVFITSANQQYYGPPANIPPQHQQQPQQPQQQQLLHQAPALLQQDPPPSARFAAGQPPSVNGRKRTWGQRNEDETRLENIQPAPLRPGQQPPSRPSDSEKQARTATADPPNLSQWRERLFNVDGMITLTEEEFNTYFPHVDNVYSHRSTQKYKKNPFVAHYWDCRLKGRPPGTKKSDDPTKRKRKRVARERDQCEVKIKIVEFFPGVINESGVAVGADASEGPGNSQTPHGAGDSGVQLDTTWRLPLLSSGGSNIHEASKAGNKIYTIQRISGSTGQQDAHYAERHRHNLKYSDEVKKNSVVRAAAKSQKEKKKTETYHKKASGNALATVKKHSADNPLKLYGSCFCPFVQRVWIALELKQIPYQYIEVDPYAKPQSLLEINPRGLVPALRHGEWGCYESTVLMEYLEDLQSGNALLPSSAQTRAHSRLWSDHINRNLIPTFYHYLQAQDTDKQVREASTLGTHIKTLVAAADPTGPFFLGPHPSFVDVQMAPWVVRLNRVLKPYRGWPDPEPGSRWEAWVRAIEADEAVRATTSEDVLYLDSYERYAENRPDTSQLANAVNGGRGLP